MKKILLIQTGGTIAMDITHGEPRLDPSRWTDVLYNEIPELSEIADIDIEQLFFKDSSDVGVSDWVELIGYIRDKYEAYDGFVLLHGTDTMAYTASALSFGLQNLGKPVILTGSQVPMSNIRSDARRNLVNAIEMATLPVHEVAVCFNDFVYRGNRTTKMSIGDFDAFSSPNYPPLAEIGLRIELNNPSVSSTGDLAVSTSFDPSVFLLKIFPGLKPDLLEKIDLDGLRCVVIEAFGSGNFPIHGEGSLLPFFRRCLDNDLLLVFTSQAAYDAVDLSNYESGKKAQSMGALSAGDMTTEATLTKMMYLLGNYGDAEKVKVLFQKDIAGELTVPS